MLFENDFAELGKSCGLSMDPCIRKQGRFFFRIHDWYYQGILVDTTDEDEYYAYYAITCFKLGYLLKGSCELEFVFPQGQVEDDRGTRPLRSYQDAKEWFSFLLNRFNKGVADLEDKVLPGLTESNYPYFILSRQYIESKVRVQQIKQSESVASRVARDSSVVDTYKHAVDILVSRAPTVEPSLKVSFDSDIPIQKEIQMRLHFIADQIGRLLLN